ncbi:hypothetical protein M413DRAFT_14664 [Hebeloma cylindrosporum]|uniref:Uncharacterized protein n=1 Tax=Hebeloma cylindrosporum TaxID=76867 RepID=A0A0C3BEP5_HEBCY|nr:hypothetical protein M413DRAFT_14664 [Hebeloma cylindrosporum h7]
MAADHKNNIPSFVSIDIEPAPPPVPSFPWFSDLLRPTDPEKVVGASSPILDSLDMSSVQDFMGLSSHSVTALNHDMPGSSGKGEGPNIQHTGDDKTNGVHMFYKAQNVKIMDTAINNIGRDMTVVHNNYIYYAPGLPVIIVSFKLSINMAYPIFGNSNMKPNSSRTDAYFPGCTQPQIFLEENIVQDTIKSPPLDVKVLIRS